MQRMLRAISLGLHSSLDQVQYAVACATHYKSAILWIQHGGRIDAIFDPQNPFLYFMIWHVIHIKSKIKRIIGNKFFIIIILN